MKSAVTLLLLFALLSFACAEESLPVNLEENSFELLGHSVRWPQLGDPDTDAWLSAKLHSGEMINAVSAAMTAPGKITAAWEARWAAPVLSLIENAEGPLNAASGDLRSSHARYAAVLLQCEEGFTPCGLAAFLGGEDVLPALEELLQENVAPGLSAHLDASSLSPLPEDFAADESGLCLFYPASRLTALSGRAGCVWIPWHELQPILGEDSPAAELCGTAVTLDAGSPALLSRWLETGRFPSLPTVLGDPAAGVLETWGLASDPDLYDTGRYLQPDDGVFQGVYLMTDSLSPDDTLEGSIIQGIRCDRISLFGLCTGQTRREEWLAVLGEPLSTVTIDEDRAEAQRTVSGRSDYYAFGTHRLRLHADASGILVSVILLQ